MDSARFAPAPARIDILGSNLDLIGAEGTRSWLWRALRDPWDRRCRHVVTLNPEYVMAGRRAPAFARAIAAADLVTADGAGVVVAARLLHGQRPERVTGVDIVEWLASGSAETGAPLFLLGAATGVADLAAAKLRGRFPGAEIAGTWADGTPEPADDAESIRRIVETGARAVAVAYGAPGQVEWIERNREALAAAGVRIAIGIGGALDYHAGTISRPPAFVRKIGMEWLVRLAREPRRYRRQLVLPVFAALVLKQAIVRRVGVKT